MKNALTSSDADVSAFATATARTGRRNGLFVALRVLRETISSLLARKTFAQKTNFAKRTQF
jgi:hypothetical protein